MTKLNGLNPLVAVFVFHIAVPLALYKTTLPSPCITNWWFAGDTRYWPSVIWLGPVLPSDIRKLVGPAGGGAGGGGLGDGDGGCWLGEGDGGCGPGVGVLFRSRSIIMKSRTPAETSKTTIIMIAISCLVFIIIIGWKISPNNKFFIDSILRKKQWVIAIVTIASGADMATDVSMDVDLDVDHTSMALGLTTMVLAWLDILHMDLMAAWAWAMVWAAVWAWALAMAWALAWAMVWVDTAINHLVC